MQTKPISEVIEKYKSSDFVKNFVAQFQNNHILKTKENYHAKGTFGAHFGLQIAAIFDLINKPMLVILEDREVAAYLQNELEAIFSKEEVVYFPSSYTRPYTIEETANANIGMRTEVLNLLLHTQKPNIIIAYADSLFEKVVTRKSISKNSLCLKLGEQVNVDFINEMLFTFKFHRVDFVTEAGEFSVRGGIVDVFSFSDELPYRISFFGNEVDSIRTFCVDTQLSENKLDQITIVPNLENKYLKEERQSFFDFINDDTLIVVQNIELLKTKFENNFAKAEENFEGLKGIIAHNSPDILFLDAVSFVKQLTHFQLIEFSNHSFFKVDNSYEFNLKPQPSFNKKFDLLLDDLNQHTHNQYTNYLFCNSEKQLERFHDIFEDIGKEVKFTPILGTIHRGFIDEDQKIVCYTDHQIFERYHRFNLRNTNKNKEVITLKELTSLSVGDFVTHIDHGIGRFAGLMKIDANGKMQEAIKLIYQNNDILYVSIHSLHKISKYSGKEGVEVKLHKLGSPAWKLLTNKTKKRVKEIAFDLIKLYAKRKEVKGFAFAPDTYLQTELEASFLYEDTPDQLKATQAFKEDMESEQPMDRLICGDVGFGKTEIAIRAAFKAATDSKQVVVLVPTTLLAFQHHRTFKERLKDFPVNIGYLNRFKTAKQKKELLENLAQGKIDIVIGTHQLVNKEVKYKDLGLLIVDEEHKFGVNVKDKLKLLKANIDTLTLTATPIPRTLQFSLMAARDLSVIKTPPPNRQPVDTELIGFNEERIRDAISYEIQRGGQVYFIHNRIENLREVVGMIQRLVPEAKVAFGHGQLEGTKLEDLMLDFMEGNFDVLVSTTIIESGMDVSNANTIFINDAHRFGLADLHQMRGRVGRSNRKAFCYLISPPLDALTKEARRRLQAIEMFSDLGAGFNIAMKDLEIRGAGDLLGAEQSGFISDIGFDAYQKILNEAVHELKETDFKDLYEEEEADTEKTYVTDVQIDTDFEILLPDEYINSVTERLILYNQLTAVENQEQLEIFEKQLIDRFGPLPTAAENLLKSIQIKWLGKYIGFEKIVLKQNTMLCYFVSNPQSEYYQSVQFQKVLQFLQENPKTATFKEKPPKTKTDKAVLLLRFEKIESIQTALNILDRLLV